MLSLKFSGRSRSPLFVVCFLLSQLHIIQTPGLKALSVEDAARLISRKTMYDVVLGISYHPLVVHRTTDAKHILPATASSRVAVHKPRFPLSLDAPAGTVLLPTRTMSPHPEVLLRSLSNGELTRMIEPWL